MEDKKSILIVDDDKGARESLKFIFDEKGYEIETARTGREAMEKSQGRFFNVALLDIKLPDMEGVELLAPLKESHPDIEVIMVTAYASLETALRSLNEGASAYITKPMNMDDVLAKIRQVIEKQHLVMENRRLLKTAQRELVERKRAEKEKAQLEEQLRQSQKMEAVGQLTAGIAHHFNNMLTGIMGSIELAKIDAPKKIQCYLELAMTNSERAADMIKTLMLFARPGPLEPKTIDIKSVIDDTINSCRRTCNRKIEITVESSDNLPLVSGDLAELQQAFANLCFNARDALASLSTDDNRSPSIKIKVSTVSYNINDGMKPPEVKPGQYLRVSVSDNGIGMDQEMQERIFEPFFTTKEVGKGTGLGLATVYAILKRHNGWIDCQSQLGVGTTFNLYLPIVTKIPGATESISSGYTDVGFKFPDAKTFIRKTIQSHKYL